MKLSKTSFPSFLIALLLVTGLSLISCKSGDEKSILSEPASSAETQKTDTKPTDKTASVSETAETIYTNAKVYTVNDKQPWAEAFAVKNGKFLVVGSNAEVEAVKGDSTNVINLEGRMVLPGLIDVHVHPLGVAEGWAGLRINEPNDIDAMLAQIKEYASANPDLPVIRGEAWNLNVFPNDSPRKELLDEIVPDKPVYMMSQTGHSAWVNSKALELAGITKNTPVTEKFIYDKDPETGEPSGTVREFAMGAVEQKISRAAPDVYAPQLKKVLSEFNQFGFTSLKPAEGAKTWVEGAMYLDKNTGLTVRLFPAWDWQTSHYLSTTTEEVEKLIANWEQYSTDMLYPRYVKIFYDGAPDSYTALLLEDYEGRPGFKGASNLPKDEMKKHIKRFNKNGIGVLTHVLGDGGGKELADIYIEVRKENGDNGTPLQFSHAWLARPEDIKRLAGLKDTCIDFSPVLAYPAPEIEGSMAPPIGDKRYQTFFNARSAFEAGVPVGFGSDWASALIPDPNGFHQMQSWITRQDPENPKSGTLNKDQAITLEQAIQGFTIGGAQCIGFGWDEKIGSIEDGKLADFIVLDKNIFDIPINELYKTKVLMTVVNGNLVYDRDRDKEIDSIDEEEFKPGTRYTD